MFLPVGASLSLLIMFLFFDSLQMIFAVCTASELHFQEPLSALFDVFMRRMFSRCAVAVLATVAFAFLLLPMCQYFLRPCFANTK